MKQNHCAIFFFSPIKEIPQYYDLNQYFIGYHLHCIVSFLSSNLQFPSIWYVSDIAWDWEHTLWTGNVLDTLVPPPYEFSFTRLCSPGCWPGWTWPVNSRTLCCLSLGFTNGEFHLEMEGESRVRLRYILSASLPTGSLQAGFDCTENYGRWLLCRTLSFHVLVIASSHCPFMSE